jgi:hypothetical protein
MKIKKTDVRKYFPITLLRASVTSYTAVYNFTVLNPNTTFKIKFGVLLLRKRAPTLHIHVFISNVQKKVQIKSLCFMWQHAMKVHGGVVVCVHEILTST